jgi:hypothetical protein
MDIRHAFTTHGRRKWVIVMHTDRHGQVVMMTWVDIGKRKGGQVATNTKVKFHPLV